MKQPKFLITVFIVAAFAIYGACRGLNLCGSSKNTETPRFVLPNPDGKKVNSTDLSGARLIHFWASWCPPCMDELPELMDAAAASTSEKLKYVLVSNDSSWEGAMKVIHKGKTSSALTLLLDADSKVAESYGTFQLPETYLVSADGKILMKWIGPQKWKSDAIQKGIEEILKRGTQAIPNS